MVIGSLAIQVKQILGKNSEPQRQWIVIDQNIVQSTILCAFVNLVERRLQCSAYGYGCYRYSSCMCPYEAEKPTITILIFYYYRSSAPPLYLLLFLSATYILQRPCVYCSLLLAILILVLFDFNRNWFESPSTGEVNPANDIHNASSLQDILSDTASLAGATLNATAAALAEAANTYLNKPTETAELNQTWTRMGGEWLKTVFTRREIRISCLNAVIRL